MRVVSALSMKLKCKIVTFAEVYDMVKNLSASIKASKYEPTTVIGLARGGWFSARLICDFLGLTDLVSLKCEHWIQTGKTKDDATIRYPLTADLTNKRILIVDDITDTGKSLITSTEYLAKLNPREVRTATMQYIPASKFVPDYYAEEVKVWTWFIYPWNWIEDTTTLIVRLITTQKDKEWSLDEIGKGLADSFDIKWSKKMLRYMLKVMKERSQIEKKGRGAASSYKLREGKTIQL